MKSLNITISRKFDFIAKIFIKFLIFETVKQKFSGVFSR